MKREATVRLRGDKHKDFQWVYIFEKDDHCQGYPTHSAAFFCPQCAKVWAIISLTGQAHAPHSVGCTECKWSSPNSEVPGSLIFNGLIFPGGTDTELLFSLPHDLLLREFNLHLETYYHEEILLNPPTPG